MARKLSIHFESQQGKLFLVKSQGVAEGYGFGFDSKKSDEDEKIKLTKGLRRFINAIVNFNIAHLNNAKTAYEKQVLGKGEVKQLWETLRKQTGWPVRIFKNQEALRLQVITPEGQVSSNFSEFKIYKDDKALDSVKSYDSFLKIIDDQSSNFNNPRNNADHPVFIKLCDTLQTKHESINKLRKTISTYIVDTSGDQLETLINESIDPLSEDPQVSMHLMSLIDPSTWQSDRIFRSYHSKIRGIVLGKQSADVRRIHLVWRDQYENSEQNVLFFALLMLEELISGIHSRLFLLDKNLGSKEYGYIHFLDAGCFTGRGNNYKVLISNIQIDSDNPAKKLPNSDELLVYDFRSTGAERSLYYLLRENFFQAWGYQRYKTVLTFPEVMKTALGKYSLTMAKIQANVEGDTELWPYISNICDLSKSEHQSLMRILKNWSNLSTLPNKEQQERKLIPPLALDLKSNHNLNLLRELAGITIEKI